jgi:hypothetical protein
MPGCKEWRIQVVKGEQRPFVFFRIEFLRGLFGNEHGSEGLK